MAKNRINKINEEVRRELATVIRELKDERIPLLTSVVAVNVTNDLSYAKCYISVMGDDEVKKKALEGLKSASGYIRREMGRRVDLRITPEFLFELDRSIEHGAHINKVLQDIMKGQNNDE
ncbi:MAG: 30S ribosome-binding factor RbfA [Clostridia bacterium]|nr:30S ribosome-binding factor RbfA [Clostridia bacterium]